MIFDAIQQLYLNTSYDYHIGYLMSSFSLNDSFQLNCQTFCMTSTNVTPNVSWKPNINPFQHIFSQSVNLFLSKVRIFRKTSLVFLIIYDRNANVAPLNHAKSDQEGRRHRTYATYIEESSHSLVPTVRTTFLT